MKTPITYYGGKQRMIPTILPLIPAHRCYVEPFCGGASVFFAKPLAKSNCINDVSDILVNFYRVLKTNSDALISLINATPYSRSCFDRSQKLLKSPDGVDAVELAWAYFICSKMGFAGKWNDAWGYDRCAASNVKAFHNTKDRLYEAATKIDSCHIECSQYSKVVERFDSQETFFYVDPPYIDTDQGHYSGWGWHNMEDLMLDLDSIKGRFMLSHYETDWINEWANQCGYSIHRKATVTSAAKTDKARDARIEVLIMNYNVTVFENRI